MVYKGLGSGVTPKNQESNGKEHGKITWTPDLGFRAWDLGSFKPRQILIRVCVGSNLPWKA